jgi:hypothetical protein
MVPIRRMLLSGAAKAFGGRDNLQSLRWRSLEHVGDVRGGIVALIVLVTALGGSRFSQRWAIWVSSLVAAALLAIWVFLLREIEMGFI